VSLEFCAPTPGRARRPFITASIVEVGAANEPGNSFCARSIACTTRFRSSRVTQRHALGPTIVDVEPAQAPHVLNYTRSGRRHRPPVADKASFLHGRTKIASCHPPEHLNGRRRRHGSRPLAKVVLNSFCLVDRNGKPTIALRTMINHVAMSAVAESQHKLPHASFTVLRCIIHGPKGRAWRRSTDQ